MTAERRCSNCVHSLELATSTRCVAPIPEYLHANAERLRLDDRVRASYGPRCPVWALRLAPGESAI